MIRNISIARMAVLIMCIVMIAVLQNGFRATATGSKEDETIKESEIKPKTDEISPEVIIYYKGKQVNKVVKDGETITRESMTDADASTRFIYDGAIEVDIEVSETNFIEEDFLLSIRKDGRELENYGSMEWIPVDGTGKLRSTIILQEDGDYEIIITYSDSFGNVMNYRSNEYENKEGQQTYISNIHTIDSKAPIISIIYEGEKGSQDTEDGFYTKKGMAVIAVTDPNFRPDMVKLNVVSKDIQGVERPTEKFFQNHWTDWIRDTGNPDKWYTNIFLEEDGRYQLDVTCEDLAGNIGKTSEKKLLVIDGVAPDPGKMRISYSKELSFWEKVINTVSFGYYAYKDEVTVTLEAEDDISGIDSLEWSFSEETGTIDRTDILYTENGKRATAKFTINATVTKQFKGEVSFVAIDKAGNRSDSKKDSGRIIIIDNIAPKGTVTYSQEKQKVNGTLYYDDSVTAKITIIEDNFYKEDVDIKVNGRKEEIKDWTQNGEQWSTTLLLSGDGEYIITISYEDRCGNKMKEYCSEKIVIDTIDPVIDITYSNTNIINTVDGVSYYDDIQKAKIRITEHNFSPENVGIYLSAQDVAGKSVTVINYADFLAKENNWIKDGDTYTAELIFSEDANYVFQISYTDFAKHQMTSEKNKFTVDTLAPQNLSIIYSASVSEQMLGTVSYGFYRDQVNVTITAEDETSGISHFTYSFKQNGEISDVGALLLSKKIEGAQVRQEGKLFVAEFSIPKELLGEKIQFDGTMEFTAFDVTGKSAGKTDSKRIIVDSISPVADVSYNEPIHRENGVSYYAESITFTITIRETNFYAEDVKITVVRDGNYYDVDAVWTKNGPDIHTGTFLLQEDGDYIIQVKYSDRSGNGIKPYISQQMIIDTEKPSVFVTNIIADSAIKEEHYGFAITAKDFNLDEDTFLPTLTALVRNEKGGYTVKNVAFEKVKKAENENVYTYIIENLDVDAIYTLSCYARDMSGNEITEFELENGEKYETVRFSVNRNGSVFTLDQNIKALINQYYIYEIHQDIVIHEINVDPIGQYTVTLNGQVLKEGTEYITTHFNDSMEWSVRTYTVKRELFREEGSYRIVIESVDKAGSVAYSDIKGVDISFVVDRTAPTLVISGLENNGRYQTAEQTVTVIPSDDGGKLQSVTVMLLDKDGHLQKNAQGKDVSVRFDMADEALETYLAKHDGRILFTVPEGVGQQILISCKDRTIRSDGTTNEYYEIFRNVTVSPNGFLLFYANKPLFYGGITGVLLLALAGALLIIGRRRRRK